MSDLALKEEITPGDGAAKADTHVLTQYERAVRFFGLKVIGLDGAISLLMVAIALWMTVAVQVIFEPLWGFTTRVFSPFLYKVVLPIVGLAFGFQYLLRNRRPTPQSIVVRKPFWNIVNLANLVRVLGLLYFTTMSISNIKPLMTLYTSRNYDHLFRKIDTWLFFGNDPFVWMSQFRQPWLQMWLDTGYMSLFVMFFITLGMLFVQKRTSMLRVFVLSMLLAKVIGNAIHFAVPTTGDVFTYDHWYLYDDISFSTISRRLQMGLYRAIETIQNDRQNFVPTPFVGIAAFPSLHVAQLYLFCAIAWKYHRWLLIGYIPMGILLTISTMYFGWHYFTDIVGGLLVAWLALWLSRKIIAWNLRLDHRFLKSPRVQSNA